MSSAPMIDALLLDMDGVLLDTTPAHASAYERLFAEQGVRFGRQDFVERALGVPREEVLRRVLGPQLGGERLARLMRRKVELVEEHLAEHPIARLPGVDELLAWASALAIPRAVATSSRTPGLFLGAAGLGEAFEVVVSGADVEHNKPAPDVYLEAARRLGVDPGRCLVLEDSPSGVAAARAAGATCWAVRTGAEPGALAQADAIFEGIVEVHQALARGRP